MARKSRTVALGNLAVLTLLVATCTSFVFITEGAWWPADPPASRWSWAAISLIGYGVFSLWTFKSKKKRKPNVNARQEARIAPRSNSSEQAEPGTIALEAEAS
ncbi:hypothetical protein [Rubinisphaera brasiliensis]|uniref:Uncharacterized protein n=1 Tax=Rubinisphaera brasiliensis (strain ATCC 49424 / DSM 5305 / JCM 21570 / IAM 15109 / NBRC 103401 / IFAM 1448) TaxID=756272 RepID=F0SI83_RUBBR|nr:hypothetical protein [Rubinisphaera brasiliensis]ADY61785.1 hypothetical protein Plabr_4212 [Rubinisphaera brasiliensis DSM 5305]